MLCWAPTAVWIILMMPLPWRQIRSGYSSSSGMARTEFSWALWFLLTYSVDSHLRPLQFRSLGLLGKTWVETWGWQVLEHWVLALCSAFSQWGIWGLRGTCIWLWHLAISILPNHLSWKTLITSDLEVNKQENFFEGEINKIKTSQEAGWWTARWSSRN